MSRFTRLSAVVAAITAAFAATMIMFAGSAGAYPDGIAPTLTTTPISCGQPAGVTGTGYQPGETVTITDTNGDTITVVADANGHFSATITITCSDGSLPTSITATGGSSGAKGVESLQTSRGGGSDTNGNSGADGTSNTGSGSGSLSNTGVAVIGIGALGVVLLGGGGLLLVAGRRRRIDA